LALSCFIILACGGGGNTTPDGEGAALPPVEPPPLAVIDPARRIEWEGHAGVPGGIPQRETICATIDAAAYGNGTTDVK
jgi:hypothetical protein